MARIRLIYLGIIKGGYFVKYLLLKPYLKMIGFIALLNGSYNIGLYDGMLSGVHEITVLPLTKIQTFWLWVYNVHLGQFIMKIVNNISYYTMLPINLVIFSYCIFIIFVLFFFNFKNKKII